MSDTVIIDRDYLAQMRRHFDVLMDRERQPPVDREASEAAFALDRLLLGMENGSNPKADHKGDAHKLTCIIGRLATVQSCRSVGFEWEIEVLRGVRNKLELQEVRAL